MGLILPTPLESLGAGSPTEILFGTGESVPSGVDGLISFGGFVMNDRNLIDTYVVTKIGGMGDPDIRDDREPNPSRDGETPFDAFYGGRTLTLTGYIRAYELAKLDDMETALKGAFISLEEKPLIFHGRNYATTTQIWGRKNAPIVMEDEQTRDDLFRRDFMITFRASMPAFVSMNEEFTFKTFGEIDNFNLDSIGAGKYEGLTTAKVEGGLLVPTSTAAKLFVRKDQVNDFTYPRLSIDYKGVTTFTGSVLDAHLKKLNATNYLRGRLSATGVMEFSRFDEGAGTGMGAPTMVKGSSTVTRSLGTTYRLVFRVEGEKFWFEHGPATGEPDSIGYWTIPGPQLVKFVNGIRAKSWFEITPPNLEWRYDNIIFGSAQMDHEPIGIAVNRGNYDSFPRFHIVGPILNPKITNDLTGEELIFEEGAFIPKGDTWVADVANGTLTDENGVNKFEFLDALSDWPIIASGENPLRLTGSETGTQINGSNIWTPSTSVYHRHSWF